MLHADGVAELLNDSRARFLAITGEFAATAVEAAALAPELAGLLADRPLAGAPVPVHLVGALAAAPFTETCTRPARTRLRSGCTRRAPRGAPKAAMHRHGAIEVVCETYGAQVLGIRRDDRCLSAAKAFFAYGLGNSVLFPLAAAASAVLEPSPSGRMSSLTRPGSTAPRCSSPARRFSRTCSAPSCRPTL